MVSKFFSQSILRRAKEVFNGILKHKTQNVGVKVAQLEKPLPVVRYQSQITESKLFRIWQKVLPRFYFNSQASRLGRQAAWRSARNVQLLSFVGLVIAQHAEKEEDEIVEKIQEFVKNTSVLTSPLMQQVQQLSLGKFEFGQLIGQGCNAAVYEARLKEPTSPIFTETETDAKVYDTEGTLPTDDIIDDAIESIETRSDITVLSAEDDLSLDEVPSEFCTYDDSNLSDVHEDVSDPESDFEIICQSDDDMDDDDICPLQFTVPLLQMNISVSSVSLLDSETKPLEEMEVDPGTLLSVNAGKDSALSCHTVYSQTGDRMVWQSGPDLAPSESIAHMTATETSDKFNLAIKMMFNYSVESNASAILREMEREAVPARVPQTQQQMGPWQNQHKVRKKSLPSLPPHPNIVEMWGVFVDSTPQLPDGLFNYPAALPTRLNPQGIGRNMTMFLVMKKYHCTLEEYLSKFNPSMRERLQLLAQLFEALDHLRKHNIAHRDLKPNNVFLDTLAGDVPQLVVGDFGCCLADDKHGLYIPYNNEYFDKGGNTALMAPEISTAEPGQSSYLDYRKSDLWAAGTLAYQILGADNPFWTGFDTGMLDSRSYMEQDLPCLPDEVPDTVKCLISAVLKRDPSKRPTARQAANLLHVLLWAPSDWLLPSYTVSKSQVMWWLISVATEVHLGSKTSERSLKRSFLQNINIKDLRSVLRFARFSVD